MFDERFVRTWRLYLAGSQTAFRTGDLQLFQVLFERTGSNRLPMTRERLFGQPLQASGADRAMTAEVEHETIIVGAGPAGASAAWELHRKGRDCLLLDRETFPREKLCAGWITPDVLADLEFEPADYPYRFLTFDSLQISIGKLRFPFHSPQHSIRRFEFDRWLVERSEVPVRQHRVKNIVADRNGFLLDEQYRCRYLIGAGGTRCPVERGLFRGDGTGTRHFRWSPRNSSSPVIEWSGGLSSVVFRRSSAWLRLVCAQGRWLSECRCRCVAERLKARG